jgi:hypothetical protein
MRKLLSNYYKWQFLGVVSLFVLVIPISPNYQLNELNVSNGGGVSQSTNYGAEQSVGEVSTTNMHSSLFGIGLGFGFSQMAQEPTAPTFTNPSNYYDRLKIVVNPGTNASDALFLLAISSDNFATTQYIQPDGTVSSSVSITDYQTYAAWGGASGTMVINLAPSTTYKVKAKAKQGNYTETGFGPTASASTVASSLSFDIDVAPTDTTTSPPYTTNLGSLLAGTVITGSDKVWVSFDTNTTSGGTVYVSGQQGGLHSANVSHLITSSTGDLSSLSEGFGLQGSSATQSAGGPLSITTPYDGSSNNVGVADSVLRPIFSSPAQITAGRGSFSLKAKASTSTPASTDYQEILTVIAAAGF